MQTKSIQYTFILSGYFSRRIPSDLQHHYYSVRVIQGLWTSSPQKARVQSNITAAKLDAYLRQMRITDDDAIGYSFIKPLEADPDNR